MTPHNAIAPSTLTPQPLSHESLLRNLAWRYAVKKFDATKQISAQTWDALERSLVLTPSSFGLQPWKFVVVRDRTVREKLRAASWDQTQITDASHLVVFASRTSVTREEVQRHITRIAEIRGASLDSLDAYKNMMLGFIDKPTFDSKIWATKQAYIALGWFLFAAAQLGVDACPMEGIDPAKYNEILGLTSRGFTTNMVATAGYRAADDTFASLAKVRFKDSDVVEYV